MANRGALGLGRRLGIALLAALSLSAAAAGTAVAAEGEPAFCERQTLHDYLSRFEGMPKLRELPYRRTAEPLFHGVRIGAAGPSLAIGGGSAGYQLQWDRNPDWDVTVTLAAVNVRGKVLRWEGKRTLRTAASRPAETIEPRFSLTSSIAFYRTTMTIRTASGRRLATFGNYYRVVVPKVAASFATEAPAYRPGETVFARLDNAGASYALFGEGFKVEGLTGETWGPVAAAPGPYATPLQFVGPGSTSGHCLVFPVPTSMPAGRYRLAQETVFSWPTWSGQERPVLTTEFEVAAP